MTEPVTANVPLSDLYLHPYNTRSEPPAEQIEALAASIADMGLLQNLSGYRETDEPFQAATPGIGIVAGGRRLRALLLLATRAGQNPAEVMIPVRITEDDGTARLWATAENAARQPLHPADEVRAYARMKATGEAVPVIARAFAVTERHVKQRLTLAGLPADALDALRDNSITLDQAGALTCALSEAALLAELRRVVSSRWNIDAADIRRNLREKAVGVTDRRVKWIGLERYIAAGGTVQEDLFTEEVRILDEALLDQLFADRLENCAMMQEMRGWAWVKVWPETHVTYTETEKFDTICRTPIDLPQADAEELDRLQSLDEPTEDELARIDELEERAEGDYSDEDRASAGVYLYVDYDGKLQIKGPYRERPKPESDPDAPAEAKADKIPSNLLEDMQRIQMLAIQTALLDQPELVLDLLTTSLTATVWGWHRPLAIGPEVQSVTPSKPGGVTTDERLGAAIHDGKGGSQDLHPGHLAQVQAMGKKARNAALTAALASLWRHPANDFAAHVAQRAKADIRAVWTPTAEAFFSRLPVARLDAIWAELVPEGAVNEGAWQVQKKSEKARALHDLFHLKSYRDALHLSRDACDRIAKWLPEEMRWTGGEE